MRFTASQRAYYRHTLHIKLRKAVEQFATAYGLRIDQVCWLYAIPYHKLYPPLDQS